MDVQSAENGGIVDQEEHEEVLVKRIITAHPLYGLLVETHLKCLEVRSSPFIPLLLQHIVFVHSHHDQSTNPVKLARRNCMRPQEPGLWIELRSKWKILCS